MSDARKIGGNQDQPAQQSAESVSVTPSASSAAAVSHAISRSSESSGSGQRGRAGDRDSLSVVEAKSSSVSHSHSSRTHSVSRSHSRSVSVERSGPHGFSMVSSSSSSYTVTHSYPAAVVPIDPFLSLELGKEYKIADFTGRASLPAAAGPILGTSNPVWRHDSCTFKVLQDAKLTSGQKRLQIRAKSADGDRHPGFGLTGDYTLEAVLEKKGGVIICTEIKGVSGKISIPGAVKLALNGASFGKSALCFVGRVASLGFLGGGSSQPSLGWDDLAAYNTGSIPQNLPVEFKRTSDGEYTLTVVVDPQKLELEGASSYLLGILKKLNVLGPATLEGSISLTPSKKHDEDHDKGAGGSFSFRGFSDFF